MANEKNAPIVTAGRDAVFCGAERGSMPAHQWSGNSGSDIKAWGCYNLIPKYYLLVITLWTKLRTFISLRAEF